MTDCLFDYVVGVRKLCL